VGGVSDEAEGAAEAPAEEVVAEEEVAAAALEPEAEEPKEAPVEPEVPVAVEEATSEGDESSTA